MALSWGGKGGGLLSFSRRRKLRIPLGISAHFHSDSDTGKFQREVISADTQRGGDETALRRVGQKDDFAARKNGPVALLDREELRRSGPQNPGRRSHFTPLNPIGLSGAGKGLVYVLWASETFVLDAVRGAGREGRGRDQGEELGSAAVCQKHFLTPP